MMLTLLLEPISRAWTGLLASAPLTGLLFLVIAGTFIAYTICCGWREIGGSPAQACMHCVARGRASIGLAVLEEPIGWREILATLLLFGAASVALAPAFARAPCKI